MKLRRILAAALAAALLCALLAAPAGAAGVSSFSDITDPQVGQAAEVLRMLGVVNGTGNNRFEPGGTLTRAQFCKMILELMGKGEEAQAQANRTIFRDVTGGHWARGYVNLAATTTVGAGEDGTGGSPIVAGMGDGTFAPDRAILYREAVTVMLRVLGYTAEANRNWPAGALSAAASVGLDRSVEAQGDKAITRAQAAILFSNMLTTKPKGSTTIFASTLGQLEENCLILTNQAKAQDGTGDAVLTDKSDVPYKMASGTLPDVFVGQRGTLLLDQNGRLITVLSAVQGSRKAITTLSAEAISLTAVGGETFDLAEDTVVWTSQGKKTYGEYWVNLDRVGVAVVVYYSPAGKVDYLYVSDSQSREAMVARTAPKGNPFTALAGEDTDYTIYKNGVEATAADIRQYDVATYDASAKAMHISDLKLTGILEEVSPNPDTPTRITLMGREFTVLPTGTRDLSAFQVGKQVTLLLTVDGRVAGAVEPSVARSNAVGLAAIEGTKATVKLLGTDITLTGETGLSEYGAAQLQGQLVTVSASRKGYLGLSRYSGSAVPGDLDVAGRTVGSTPLAGNCRVFDRVGTSAMVEISLKDVPLEKVSAARITYMTLDYAGRVSLLVLEDVTGQCYTYGRARLDTHETVGMGDLVAVNKTLTVENGRDKNPTVIGGISAQEGEFVGIAPSVTTLDGIPRVAKVVSLMKVDKVRRGDFDADGSGVTVGGVRYPVAADVACYNAASGTWFENLSQARAYSDNLTIYYDRDVSQGGQVRVVVAN